jgi:hypothetical protein
MIVLIGFYFLVVFAPIESLSREALFAAFLLLMIAVGWEYLSAASQSKSKSDVDVGKVFYTNGDSVCALEANAAFHSKSKSDFDVGKVFYTDSEWSRADSFRGEK